MYLEKCIYIPRFRNLPIRNIRAIDRHFANLVKSCEHIHEKFSETDANSFQASYYVTIYDSDRNRESPTNSVANSIAIPLVSLLLSSLL